MRFVLRFCIAATLFPTNSVAAVLVDPSVVRPVSSPNFVPSVSIQNPSFAPGTLALPSASLSFMPSPSVAVPVPSAVPAVTPSLVPAALPSLAAAVAPSSEKSPTANPAAALDAFWDSTAKRDRKTVESFAVLANLNADPHGRVTPELQSALTRIESTRAHSFSRGARSAWQTMMARLGATTSLPIGVPGDSVPYWQKDGHPLAAHGAHSPLPETADIVIVGAGLTGASAAHALVAEGAAKGLKVVILDAGDPATQATGRNGGNFHLMPENYVGEYQGLAKERAKLLLRLNPEISKADAKGLGEAQARAILRLASVNRERLLDLVRSENIDADLAPNGSVRAARSAREETVIREEAAFAAAQGFAVKPLTAREVDDALGLAPGTSAFGGRLSELDGNYHPFKYAVGVLQASIARGAELFARTPVAALTKDGDAWSVVTPRGTIRTKKVILATNAFTSALLPQMAAVTPYRSQIQITEHVAERWGARLLTADSGDLYGHHPNGERYEGADGVTRAPLLIGGGKDAPTKADPRRVPRSRRTHELLRAKRDALLPELAGVPPSREWAGPTAFTPDFLPAIGELEPGLIVAAGFNGYGGVYTQAAGLAAAKIALDGRAPDWAPQEIFSPKRLLPKAAPALNDLPAAMDGPERAPALHGDSPLRTLNSFWSGFADDDSLVASEDPLSASDEDAGTAAPWLALRDARWAAGLDAAVGVARETKTGRAALDAAEKALAAEGRTLTVVVKDLGRNWGEYDYLDGTLYLHSGLFKKGREAVLAGTLSHELIHLVQHARGLPSFALELEIEAHLADMALMDELGLAPQKNTFSKQAVDALAEGPDAFVTLLQAAVPGSPYLGESTVDEVIEQLEDELATVRRRKSARSVALGDAIERDIASLRTRKGRAAYEAFSKRVRAELSRRSKAARAAR